jgi:hypothetical protein
MSADDGETLTFTITGRQKQSEAALLAVGVDAIVRL